MAKIRGGDITQLMIDGREFDPFADSDITYRLAGWTNETTPTGNGGVSTSRKRKLGGFDSLGISVDPERKDLETLQKIADKGEPVSIAITLAGGQVYAGSLTIQGEVDASSGDGKVDITATGSRFELI